MPFIALFVSATKLAGILVTLSLAANAFSYSRYRRKYLRPFRSPIDESSDTLAVFNVSSAEEEGSKKDEFFFGLATAPAHVEDRLNDAWLQFAEEHPCDDSDEVQNPKPADALMASATGDGGSQQAPVGSAESKRSKRRKTLKIAMEAMIRGFEKYLEEEEEPESSAECSHNVAAWHNVPHPEERLRFWSDPDTELELAKETGISVFRMGIDWSRIMPEEPVNGVKATLACYRLIMQHWNDINGSYKGFAPME